MQDVIDNLDGSKHNRFKKMPPKLIGRRIKAIDLLEENNQQLVLPTNLLTANLPKDPNIQRMKKFWLDME